VGYDFWFVCSEPGIFLLEPGIRPARWPACGPRETATNSVPVACSVLRETATNSVLGRQLGASGDRHEHCAGCKLCV
jgi:hypothetical protein